MSKKYNVTLTEDQLVDLTNMIITLDANQEELRHIEDAPSDGEYSVWECLQAPLEVVRQIVYHLEG